MGWNDDCVYLQAEKFDLTLVDELDDPEACWSFGILAVWQHKDGNLYWADDFGCSCPSPFEDFNSIDDLTKITDESWDDFRAAVEAHCTPYDKSDPDPIADERAALLSKVGNLLGR